MDEASSATTVVPINGSTTTAQFSLPLPRSVDTRIYIHLTLKSKAVMVFLTTASAEELGSPAPMGSFVYALPDRFNATQPLCTPLYTVEPTLEFTTRLAKLLVRRFDLPVYVGNSVSLASAGLGGTVEEEMEAFRAVFDAVVSRLQGLVGGSGRETEGVTAVVS